MPITTENIKLLRSERMQDTDDGGGQITGSAIIDGASNNIFPDISELDRAYGRVNLRKAFAAIHTDDVSLYGGAHMIIERPPQDDKVSCTLFTTESWSDERDDAANRIESYLSRGPKFAGYLYDLHITGQSALVLLCRTTTPLLDVGETLVVVKDAGLSTEQSQFVRITSVSSITQDFDDERGTYTRQIMTVLISDPLTFDVMGGQPSRYDEANQGSSFKSKIYTTIVADAARYYGCVALAETADIGDLSVMADSIFTQLVPSAQQEIPIVDASPYGTFDLPMEAADGTVSFNSSATFSPTAALYIGQGCYPGSLTITQGANTLTDQGGRLMQGTAEIGSVDYANGIVSIGAGGPSFGGTKTVVFKPSVTAPRDVRTARYDITDATRSGTVTGFLKPNPAPSTLRVSYRAQGKWYVLQDDGSGALRGADPAFGGGTINYTTGSVIVTMGALPDVDTAVMFAWSAKTVDVKVAGTALKAEIQITLANSIAPGTVSITWNDGSAKTATDNGSGGITGDATGTVLYEKGQIRLKPNTVPSMGTVFTIARTVNAVKRQSVESISVEADFQTYIIDLPDTNILPGRVELTWPIRSPLNPGVASGRIARVRDDGAGNLIGITGATVDYSLGRITLKPHLLSVQNQRYTYSMPVIFSVSGGGGGGGGTGYSSSAGYGSSRAFVSQIDYNVDQAVPQVVGGLATFTVDYATAGSSNTTPDTHTLSQLTLVLREDDSAPIIPGSVRFTWNSKSYTDALGLIVSDIDHSTGLGTERGGINLGGGFVTLNNWSAGTNSGTLTGMVISVGSMPVNEMTFRTPAAPLRPASLSIAFQFIDDPTTQVVTAASDGTISASWVKGSVDYESGVVRLSFGQQVTAAGNESQPWYLADLVDGAGKIWKPRDIVASTLRFACTAYTYIPLDADILGIDPVRLPTDGRVPIFRTGYIGVVHHTGTVSGVYSAGSLVNCGRVRLGRVRVREDGGTLVPEDRYAANLDAGTVTFINTSGLDQPLTVEHTIYDLALISDAQINGQVTFTRPLTHDFPIGSYVSSALIAGDLFARYSNMFEQTTWTGAWSDSLIGSQPLASFNDAIYPVVVTNKGAITERWALIFTSATAFRLVGEAVGEIAAGNTATDLSPINPATGVPYFTLDAAGFGSGWSSGNVIRFNTIGAGFPVWIARTIAQGTPTHPNDSFTMNILGDIDA